MGHCPKNAILPQMTRLDGFWEEMGPWGLNAQGSSWHGASRPRLIRNTYWGAGLRRETLLQGLLNRSELHLAHGAVPARGGRQ